MNRDTSGAPAPYARPASAVRAEARSAQPDALPRLGGFGLAFAYSALCWAGIAALWWWLPEILTWAGAR